MTHEESPEWLSTRIAEGIQLLLALRLKRAPFAGNSQDVFAVCEAWLIVLSNHPVRWDEQLDGWRIETTFQRLAASVTEWPTPAEFLRLMPDRHQKKLPHNPPIDEMARKKGRENLQNILMRLKGKSSQTNLNLDGS